MNVVDIGCYWHPEHQGESQESIGRLIERFKPERVYGYDPQIDLVDLWEYDEAEAEVTLRAIAVWITDGDVLWLDPVSSLAAGVGEQPRVPCVDVAEVVKNAGEGCVVKIDAEGGEYALLRRLHETGTDKLISLLLVEWHGEPRPDLVDCPVEVWQ